ncbi:hypothetical protein, partial [uncultured Dubosiella sp.]
PTKQPKRTTKQPNNPTKQPKRTTKQLNTPTKQLKRTTKRPNIPIKQLDRTTAQLRQQLIERARASHKDASFLKERKLKVLRFHFSRSGFIQNTFEHAFVG